MIKGAKLLSFIVTVMACAMLPNIALAWHSPGHEAIAVIAYKDLTPAQAHEVADILRHHEDYALWMKDKPAGFNEDEYLFMKASTWPDDIRPSDAPLGDNQYSHPTWHYIDTVYDIGNQPLPPPETGQYIDYAEKLNEDILEHSHDQAARARALCWIFHLVGDIHMPLHATTLVSPQFPDGDAGGNRFHVTTSYGPTALHTFWDGLWDKQTTPVVAGLPPGHFAAPDPLKVEPLALRIMATYPRSNLPELKSHPTFASWIQESYQVAIDDVYLHGALQGSATGDNPPALPPGYEAQAERIGEARLALAGYRLADTLRADMGL